ETCAHLVFLCYLVLVTVFVPSEIAAWQPYIIFTGSMDYFPNVDAVRFFYREVFRSVRARLPRARFVIAGRNPTRAVRRLACDPAVWVTGAVPDIRPYLRGSSAAVGPLRVARGVQTKIFEAMAMGVPVAVSSRVARAVPERLLLEIHVEDDPERFAAFLVEKLRQDRPSPELQVRRALSGYYSGLHWQEQLEKMLKRAVSSRDQIELETTDIACKLPCTALQVDIASIGARKH